MADRRAVLALPGDPETLTGGYGYDRRVVEGLRALGRETAVLRLPDGFPDPTPAELDTAYARLAAQPEGVPLLVDGLALGAMPAVARALGPARALVALVHHPLALETGLEARRADALRASERAALAAARRVVTTSRTTAAMLVADYGVPQGRIVVAPPGTDREVPGADREAPGADREAPGAGGPSVTGVRLAPGSDAAARDVVRLLAVGTLVPRKGHDLLLDALAGLREARWSLAVVGDDTRDAAHARALRARVAALGLDDGVRFEGAADEARLRALRARADVFVLASRHEGWGMAYAEALASGLPVIGTTAGAIPEVVPADAGWLVPPDDVAALREALREAIGSPAARMRRAGAARAAACRLPTWADTVARIDTALDTAVDAAPDAAPDAACREAPPPADDPAGAPDPGGGPLRPTDRRPAG